MLELEARVIGISYVSDSGMKTYPFRKDFRLTKAAEFRRVYDGGRAVRSDAFVLFFLTGEADRPTRVGITVTKRFGKAVRRNRIKRLIREAFRLLHPTLIGGVDIVINVRPAADVLAQKDVLNELSALLSKARLRDAGSV